VDPIFFSFCHFSFVFSFLFISYSFLLFTKSLSLSARVVWYRSARGGAGRLAAAGGEKIDKEREREREREIERAK
jgi:hypothetical protein